jgi:capsular polysaccharide export protein
MTIICIGYYDKFSRFFLDIKRHLNIKTDSKINFKIYSIHLSGFLYTFLRFSFSCWLPFKAWLLARRKRKVYSQIIIENKSYKGIDWNDYINFHVALSKAKSEHKIALQALAYIDIFNTIFNKEQPNYLLTIGDSRLCVEIAVAVARQKSIIIYYLEQGPFNTTFFSDTGVNANLKFHNASSVKYTDETPLTEKLKSKTYQRSPLYRGLDIFIKTLFESSNLYPPDLAGTDINSYRFKPSTKSSSYDYDGDKVALLIFQIPLDVNMIYHSPRFESHLEILKSVHSNLPDGIKLVIREHPLFINKYDNEIYEYISKHNIQIDNVTRLSKALELSKIVIVNNSTVGIEAIFNYKTVVVLGNAFYDENSICLKLENKDQLAQILKNALDFEPNKVAIDNFKNLLFNTVLLHGGIKDKKLSSSKQIANHLLAHH